MKGTGRQRSLAIIAAFLAVQLGWAVGQVPERTFAGRTLEVVDKHLDLGEVYFVWPGEDSQVTFLNDAPMQRLAVSSCRVVGYVVAPFDLEEGEQPIQAGVFKIPIRSLRVGTDRGDRNLHGPRMLDAEKNPELTLEVTAIEDVQPGQATPASIPFQAVMKARATFKGKSWSISAPIELEFQPFTRFISRNPRTGEKLTIRGRFPLRLGDFGWQPPRGMAERVAEEIPVEFFLILSTVSPDKPGDPRVEPYKHHQRLRFITLLRDLNDPTQAYKYARNLMKKSWDDSEVLGFLADATLTTPGVERRDLAFARKAAERASELTDGKDPSVLDTLARVHYQRGELRSAIEMQKKAVDRLDDANPRLARSLKSTLDRYQAEAAPE